MAESESVPSVELEDAVRQAQEARLRRPWFRLAAAIVLVGIAMSLLGMLALAWLMG
jgi:hypothetical protein